MDNKKMDMDGYYKILLQYFNKTLSTNKPNFSSTFVAPVSSPNVMKTTTVYCNVL
jgi:hypothetical protein